MPDEEVSTSIGTLYSSSLGMTASVSVELQAPIITGTLSRTISFSAVADRFGRVGLVVLDDELDLLAEHAAGLVDLLLGDLGALRDVVARRGERAGQGLRDADLDGVLGGRGRGKERCSEHRQRGLESTRLHDGSPFDETHAWMAPAAFAEPRLPSANLFQC